MDEFRDDFPLNPPPLAEEPEWSRRPDSGEMHGSIEEIRANLRHLADLTRGLRREHLTDDEGRRWDFLGRFVSQDADEAETRPLQIRRGPDGVAQIRGSMIYGMGGATSVANLPLDEWNQVAVPLGSSAIWLRFQFEPNAAAQTVYGPEGEETTVYVVGSGGDDLAVTAELHAGSPPAGQNPEVNAASGNPTKDGVYYLRVGTVTRTSEGGVVATSNDLYGPLFAGFCAPSGFRVWKT